LLHLVGFDFIELPTLKMHGQTQIKSIQVVYMHARLTVNGLLKDFLKTGNVQLSEISRLYLDEKEIRSHQ
jgi:hypothetical protein